MSKEKVDGNKYEDFSLVSGGLIYSITAAIQRRLPGSNSRRNRAIIIALFTWLPLAVMATTQQLISGATEEVGFLQDLTMYTRFLVVVPFLILIEKTVDLGFIRYFQTTEKLIDPSRQTTFDKILRIADRLSNIWLPEIIILVFIYALMIFRWNELHIFDSGKDYLVSARTGNLTPAGWYFSLFSLPVYQLLVFRWLWRFFIWLYTLARFSRIPFRLESMHTDQMAGLAYLNLFPFNFSFLVMVFSTIYASMVAMEIIHEGTDMNDYIYDIIFYVLSMALLLYAPLLLYIPQLMKTKYRGMYLFGNLVTKHNRDYMNKWIYRKKKKEKILGALDNSSLNDINGSYSAVMAMKVVPVNLRLFVSSIVLILIPFIPLVFTVYGPAELFRNLIRSVFET